MGGPGDRHAGGASATTSGWPAPPDEVWALVGDPARVHEWFPGHRVVHGRGRQRTVVTRSGLPMPEQLLTVDHTLRRFQYRITAPMFREHLGTVDVHDLGDGTSLVVYSTDADPAPLALVIGGAARARSLSSQPVLGVEVPTGPRHDASTPVTPIKRKGPADGPQDPPGHHRPAALRHPRVQRRARWPAPRSSTAWPPTGIRFERAHPQSVVCMPSRSTILTGQHPSTHGVWMNGVPLPVDAPSVAEVLHGAGYRTALVGKAHFEPFLDPFLRFTENALARTGTEPAGRHPPGLRAPGDGHPRGHRARSTTPGG